MTDCPASDTIPGTTASQVTTNGVAGFGAAKGNLTAVLYARSGGKEFHSWNALGEETQTIRCVDGKCETEKFTYDAGKRIAQLTYPDGEVVTHTYDGHGSLEALSGAASYLNTMQWNARGQVVQASYGNGVAASYGYDAARGWLDAAEVRGPKPLPNTLLYRASYTYRADAQTKTVRSTTNARLNLSFRYDNLTRLTTISPENYAGAGGLAHPDSTTQTYAYDAIGNITQNSAYFGSSSYDYDDKGHLLTSIGGLKFNYRAGAITTIWGSVAGCALQEPRVFFWDAEQRLVRATQAGATVNFEYDASGQRIRKASQGSVTRFFGSHSEREEKNGQETRTQYYYAGSQLVAKKTQAIDASGAGTGASDTVWFHADHLTSTRLMTDATGAKVAHYDYAIFGEKTHESGAKAAANQKGFTSHEHDDELGLIYMKARYYDPVLGRFISPDSIIPEPGDPQSWNRYAYVRNNPFNAIDPTGHEPYKQPLVKLVRLLKGGGERFIKNVDEAKAIRLRSKSTRENPVNVEAGSVRQARRIEKKAEALREGEERKILRHQGHDLPDGSVGKSHYQTEGVPGHTFSGTLQDVGSAAKKSLIGIAAGTETFFSDTPAGAEMRSDFADGAAETGISLIDPIGAEPVSDASYCKESCAVSSESSENNSSRSTSAAPEEKKDSHD